MYALVDLFQIWWIVEKHNMTHLQFNLCVDQIRTSMVNHIREQIENHFVERLTIIGVPFGGLKTIEKKTIESQQKCQPCTIYLVS